MIFLLWHRTQRTISTALAVPAENVRTKQAALRKFRGELVRLYQMQAEMAANAGSDSERALTDGLLSELERISKAAHESIGFTYTPLEQLAVLQ